jgi:putative membrane protein
VDEPGKGKQELAEDRTDLAEDRTVLANERTFAGWMRTGFAAIAVGVGFNALFNKMDPAWIPKAIATIFLLIGIVIFATAERRACSILARLHVHEVETVRTRNLRLITGAIILATLALIAALWLVKIKEGGGS